MHSGARLVTEIRRQARAVGKKVAHAVLEQSEIADSRVTAGSVSETGVRVPCCSQRSRDGASHPGKMPNGLDILETSRIESAGDNKFQFLTRNLVQEAARQSRRQLRCGHDLQTILAVACGGRAAGGERQPTLDDNGLPHYHCRVPITGKKRYQRTRPPETPGVECPHSLRRPVRGIVVGPRQIARR
ncbi:hypothetical protein [Bradyrhizobium sp. CCBAU 45384]|uniref:hypothetical protein n=1 Tax=Bradyrhizobium sp. CCBAU 45384 TaxID=858428 RepID=UPI0023060AE0|nr:hypothetical protein [Bradyrhizobium sp. CCBAU 45384]